MTQKVLFFHLQMVFINFNHMHRSLSLRRLKPHNKSNIEKWTSSTKPKTQFYVFFSGGSCSDFRVELCHIMGLFEKNKEENVH